MKYIIPFLLFSSVVFSKQYNLKSLIVAGLKNSYQLKKEKLAILDLQVEKEKIKSYTYPQFGVLAIAAPIYEVKGNALTYEENWNKWGPFVMFKMEGGMGIYLWGLSDYANKAYSFGKRAIQQKVYMKANDIIYKIKYYYTAYCAANEGIDIVDGALKTLNKVLKKATILYEQGKGVKKTDIEKLKIALARAKTIKAELIANKNKTLLALEQYTGLNDIKIKYDSFRALNIPLQTLDHYIQFAVAKRPEYKAIRKALIAHSYLRKINRVSHYPMFVLGFQLSYAYSPVREDQTNPFLNDSYNYLRGGVGVGFQWKVDFGKWGSNNKKLFKQQKQLALLYKRIKKDIPLSIRLAYIDVRTAQETVKYAIDEFRASRVWLFSSKTAFELGTGDIKTLLDGFKAYIEAQKNFIMAIFNEHINTYKLIRDIGKEIDIYKMYVK